MMEKPSIAKLGLRGEPERLLLSLIVTHGIITKATWEAIGAFSNEELSNAMWNLTRQKLVVARPLCVGTTYFMLSKFAASELELPLASANALEGDGKLRAFARLLFFTQYYPDAVRVSKDDIVTEIGQSSLGLPQGFFHRQGTRDWLGFLRVDGHMTGVPMRSARSLRDDVLRMLAFDRVKNKLKQANFGWFWITARQSRADAVMEKFKTFDVRNAPVTVVVMPELVAVIPTKARSI
jgi:hypothetical protein